MPPLGQEDTTDVESTNLEGAASTPTPADPSAAPAEEAKDEGPKTALDAAIAAVKPKADSNLNAEDDGAAKGDEGKAKDAKEADPSKADQPQDGEKQEDGELSEEDMKLLPKKTEKSIRRLLTSRAEARTRADTAEGRIRELEPKAQSFEHVVGFMRQHELSPEEVSTGFEIMRLIKHEPQKALAALRPYVDQLTTLTGGGTLDPDLQAAMDEGRIAQDYAREMQQARSRAALAQAQADRASARMQERDATDAASRVQAERQTAWQSWVTVQKQTDPGYAAIERLVVLEAQNLMMREGTPPTNQLSALFDRAKQNVAALMPKPPKPAVTPAPTDHQSSAAISPAEPKTMLEAAMRAMRP